MKRCPRFWHAALLAGLLATAGGATSAFATGFEALSIDPAFVPKNTAPASAPAVIRGIGFTPTVTVKFDGVSATVTFINSRTLSVQIPTSAIGKETRVTVADGADSDDIFPFIYTDGVLYVKPTGNDASNGTTPATAKRTIFGALDTTTAAIPWLIKVAAGTYTESDLPVYSRVVLSGGWDPNFAVRDPDKFVTVVDGGRATLVLRTAGLDGRQVIDGLTIRNGERDGLGGGAIVITGDNTVVSNSVIVGNTSSARGGAIYSFFSTTYGGESVFSNNVILGNRSYSKSGGAINIYPFYTQGQVLDVAISDNYIMGNRSMKSFGGGVDVSTQALYGYNNVNLAMVGNVIGGNRAVTGGGIAIMASSSADDFRLNFDNNLLFGNIVTGDGGGIYFSGVGHIAASVTAATLSANAAGQDGGGGIRFAPGVSYEAGFEAKNLVVWGNTNGNYVGGPLLTYSDVQGGATGTGNIGSNPGFVAGPMGSFYLAQDANMMSPAVDAGSSSALSLSMESRTTSSTLTLDADQVDMGYHYPAGFGQSPDPLTVLRVDPQGGDLGGTEWVLIRGTGFDPGATVMFGGAAATDTLYVSPTRILAQPPAHALGSVNVDVTNPDLTTVTAASGYAYVDNLPPDWPVTVGLQSATSPVDCVRSVVLDWNPAVDAVTPPVKYSIYRELCVASTDPLRPCTNLGYFPDATNLVGTTTDDFYVDPNFAAGGADPKYIYMIRAKDSVSPLANREFNFSKRVITVSKVTGDLTPPSPVGNTLELPGGDLLDWAGAPGAVSYRVHRQTNPAAYATPASLVPLITLTKANNDLDADGITDSRYTDTALPAVGTAFFYKISALDLCNNETLTELGP